MKRYTLLTLVLLLLLALLTACGAPAETTEDLSTLPEETTTATDDTTEKPDNTDTPSENGFTSSSAAQMMEMLTAELKTGLEPLVTETLNLKDKSAFQYHFFVPVTSAVKEAVICQPMIGSVPFFVGIIKVNTAQEADTLAKDILDNVNYHKLICAAFQKAYTRAVGNTVVLIMDIDPARADTVVLCFDSLAAK